MRRNAPQFAGAPELPFLSTNDLEATLGPGPRRRPEISAPRELRELHLHELRQRAAGLLEAREEAWQVTPDEHGGGPNDEIADCYSGNNLGADAFGLCPG